MKTNSYRPVNKFSALNVAGTFTALSTSSHRLPSTDKWIQSTPSYPVSLGSSLTLSLHPCLGLVSGHFPLMISHQKCVGTSLPDVFHTPTSYPPHHHSNTPIYGKGYELWISLRNRPHLLRSNFTLHRSPFKYPQSIRYSRKHTMILQAAKLFVKKQQWPR
jgi:hypothetical protein